MDLSEFIDKKQEEATHRIEEDLERKNKEFEFIRMFVKENHNEIVHYANITTSLIPSLENIYDIANEVAHLFRNYGGGQYRLELKPEYNLDSIKDYLPIKLGFFNVDGTDKLGHLDITEKGEKIRKKYFKDIKLKTGDSE